MAEFSAKEYLKTFLNWESKLHQASSDSFALDRIEKLLTIFGRPDDKLRFVHVAGTKGKGSTCAFLAEILRASGYRVGLYTSPHLYSLCERIRVLEVDPGKDGSCRCGTLPSSLTLRAAGHPPSRHPSMPDGCISWEDIERRLRYYHDGIEQLRASGVEITFYELMTVLAVSYFAAKEAQIVVLETGLGGRLDATNVFETSVCGITPIGFDHMNVLGYTLGEIAAEKAGIIRFPSQRVVLAHQHAEAMSVIQARCAELGIHPMIVGKDLPLTVHEVAADGVKFDVEGRRKYKDLFSPLTGAHQAENAALAIGMAEDLETFGFLLTEETAREGIARVRWPARFEKVSSSPTVILDCAHTAESAGALVATFQAAYPGCKAIVVLGMSSDKDHEAVIKAFIPITEALIFTKANTPRAFDFQKPAQPRELCNLYTQVIAQLPGLCRFTSSVAEALVQARVMAGKKGIILVTGSIFVCAEVAPD